MSLYQKSYFLLRGMQQFTKSGYNSASKSFSKGDLDKDVSGNVYMVTGANSGIGKAAALSLAKKGGEVHIVCRNPERGNQAKDDIIKESSNEKVFLHILDMSKTKDVYEFAQTFSSEHSQLNVLINNAGCMVLERTLIGDIETNFATNTLGTYVLTKELLPLLKKSKDPRVITVSSGGMYLQKLNVQDLQYKTGTFDGEMSYAQNKRQQVILTEEWAKEHPEVMFSSMHPGWADTPAVQSSMPDFHRRLKEKLRTPEEGADTIVWLAVSDSALDKKKNGSFFQDRKSVPTHLPLAWTRENSSERKQFLQIMEKLATSLKPQ